MSGVTKVVFRKFKDGGDVIALFPDQEEYGGRVVCYQIIGQHGSADYRGVMRSTRAAMRDEYLPLLRELTSLGYILKLKHRKGVKHGDGST